jgi:hypothetical protein
MHLPVISCCYVFRCIAVLVLCFSKSEWQWSVPALVITRFYVVGDLESLAMNNMITGLCCLLLLTSGWNIAQISIVFLPRIRKSGREPVFSTWYEGLLSKYVKIGIYKTIILPVVLYGCETWSVTLKEEHWLRVFENRVLRRIFGPKVDEVTGGCRKLYNEFHNLYSSHE